MGGDGEGGAVTCNSADIYQTIFALKQVGRTPGKPEEAPFDGLIPGNRYGHNYRITELQCVLLRGGLSRLAGQTAKRDENAAYLADRLAKSGGPLRVAKRDPRVTRQAYYALTMHFDSAKAGGLDRAMYLKALAAEKCVLALPYDPVYRNKLLNLYDATSPVPFRDPAVVQNYATLRLPNTERACGESTLLLMHQHLLGDRAYMDQLADAVRKVNDNLETVRQQRLPDLT